MSEQPSQEEVSKWSRWFAVECNSRAWELSEQPQRSSAEDLEMLHAAHAAAFHWSKVGNALNTARATMLLAHVHAFLEHGEVALDYAQQSHAIIISGGSPDWEMAFSHAVLAHAAYAAGEAALYAEHYAQARDLGDAIANPKDQEIFMASFVRIPAP
jgi:hypothetical protein